MKIYTSYFYQVRFFPRNLVPLSTAVWPPKYFGTPETQSKDARGVIIGLNIPPLIPGPACNNLCHGACNPPHPDDCAFLRVYYKQLRKINFNVFINKLQAMSDKIAAGEGLDEVDFALMVFEKPDRLCSERTMIHRWFQEHNYEITEWTKD